MAKEKREIRCGQCGYVSPKWLGRCPDCGEWNSFKEQTLKPVLASATSFEPPQSIAAISFGGDRFSTGIDELDCVLGGGVVEGSLVLLGGEPGIGKSTLLLQAAQNIARDEKVLVISGEESPAQVRMRADRVGALSDNLYLCQETNLDRVLHAAKELKPKFMVVDSIQSIFDMELASAPGSVGQIRGATSAFMRLAKESKLPVFLIGHVTKEGAIAGPRVLEHMVDTVLYFEGDSHLLYRMVRAVKNRFGPSNELGVFEMKASGLKGVENPSAFFLSERSSTPGSVVVATKEGSRSLLVEIQVLATPSQSPMPRRLVAGLDYNRTLLILAVIEKRIGLKFGERDIFVSVAGGLRVQEPACDLGLAIAVVSAIKDVPVPPDLAIFGELGLGGEVRKVTNMDARIKEAVRLGFNRAITPVIGAEQAEGALKTLPVRTLDQAL
ncbi:MAG: DNA repair protein RadA, partial [Terriglobia bacterium]